MMKKTISIFLVFMMIFTITMSSSAFGVDKGYATQGEQNVIQLLLDNNYETQTKFTDDLLKREVKSIGTDFVNIINYLFGYRKTTNVSNTDLIIDKADTVVVNKTVKNLHITKAVGNGEVTLKNIIVTGELLIEGGGQNSIKIEDSTINKLTTKKEVGKVRILIEGNTSIDSTLVKSSAILEQQALTGQGFEEVTVDEDSSVLLAIDKKVKWMSSNTLVASINDEGVLLAKNTGAAVISVATKDGKETEICELNVVKSNEDIKNTKAIKILTIGNSFSQDSTQWIYDIAQSAGVNVIIGNIYFAGCSLESHWANAITNNDSYTYYKWTTSTMSMAEKQTMKSCILDENWDYITFQQVSGDSGQYNTFQPYLNNLVTYVKGLSTNTNMKLALNMTWAYAANSTHEKFEKYSNNQKIMYNSIVDSYQKAIAETGIDIIIPCGTAIQNARTNLNLSIIGDELTRDGYHLNNGIGRYIAGLTFFETLIVKSSNINKDLFKDVTYVPDKYSNNENLAYLAKIAVKNAVKDPYKITETRN